MIGSAQAEPLCGVLAAAVDKAGVGPVFVASYPTAEDKSLRGVAFVYDNALAVMALLACGDTVRAGRVGAALRVAAGRDRFWHDGRMRNAYRAGSVGGDGPPALPGWWDAAAGRWSEDAYQVGTATGNVAWAALALIALGDGASREAAGGLMRWVAKSVAVQGPYEGYAGGFYGEEPAPERLRWQSTEHNVDAAAAFGLLGMETEAARARGFVEAMWDAGAGRFWLGTGADGTAINKGGSGIDSQLWPLIGIADAPADWQRAKGWVRVHHKVGGGYGFRDDPDGMWTEGTAQAALVLEEPGLMGVVRAQAGAGEMLYATAGGTVRTGLALRPESVTDDFVYYHLPHLGATALGGVGGDGDQSFQS